jgi:hypothetical protein
MKNEIMYFDQMKESPFLSWFDSTEEGQTVTISHYEKVEIERTDGDKEIKWAVYFQEKEKALLLNNTNRKMLGQLFNGQVEQSIGQKVTLYYRDDIEFKGELTKGLRLRKYKITQTTIHKAEPTDIKQNRVA